MTRDVLEGKMMKDDPLSHPIDVPTKKPRTTIYIEPELFQALEERAKEEKRTISNLCNLLIEQAMKAWLESRPTDTPNPKRADKSSR
jgi:hypothetical protein